MESNAFDAREFVARRLAWERTLARLRFESLAARVSPAPARSATGAAPVCGPPPPVEAATVAE